MVGEPSSRTNSKTVARTGTLVSLLASAVPAIIAAQFTEPQFGVAAGATFPSGDFSSLGYGTGWQAMALVAIRIPHTPLGFRLDASSSTNTASRPIHGPVLYEHRVKLAGEDALFTLTSSAPTRLRAYLLAGAGLYKVTETTYGPYGNSSFEYGPEFAYNLGFGFTSGALFLEARYVHVDGFGNGFSWALFPITAGLRF